MKNFQTEMVVKKAVVMSDSFETKQEATEFVSALKTNDRRFVSVSVGWHDNSYLIDELIRGGFRIETSTISNDSDGRAFQIHNLWLDPML